MAERSHWWTERWLRSLFLSLSLSFSLFLSLSLTTYPTYRPTDPPIYLSIYLSLSLSPLSSVYLTIYLSFDPPEPQIIGKTQCFATFLPFRAPGSSFFWDFLFFDLLSSSLLFSDSSHLCFSFVHIVGSLTSKLPSISNSMVYWCMYMVAFNYVYMQQVIVQWTNKSWVMCCLINHDFDPFF